MNICNCKNFFSFYLKKKNFKLEANIKNDCKCKNFATLSYLIFEANIKNYLTQK